MGSNWTGKDTALSLTMLVMVAIIVIGLIVIVKETV